MATVWGEKQNCSGGDVADEARGSPESKRGIQSVMVTRFVGKWGRVASWRLASAALWWTVMVGRGDDLPEATKRGERDHQQPRIYESHSVLVLTWCFKLYKDILTSRNV